MSDDGPHAARFVTLDVIRGIAVMGIFSVNVVGMAMIETAYFYPTAFGFESVWDRIVWGANALLVDGRMRSLFSILFGASAALVMDRAFASGRSPAGVHFARMAVLLLIGAIHYYVVWWGDILTAYAMVGVIAFTFWPLGTRWLLVVSALVFALSWQNEVARVTRVFAQEAAATAPGASPEDRSAWRFRLQNASVSAQEISADKALHRSPAARLQGMDEDRAWQPLENFAFLWPETLALMLLGMAGLRSGFLTGAWPRARYRAIAAGAIGIGILAYGAFVCWVFVSDFRLPVVIAADSLSAPLRPLMALGYAALIILLLGNPGAVRDRVAAVGRAAFTNYLGCSLIGVAVFHDVGLGLYAEVSRAEAWLLVPLVWALMLAWSKPWLDRFHYGPLEWVWRSLSRGGRQPFRRAG